jgi:SAM-dependent methyltransferase
MPTADAIRWDDRYQDGGRYAGPFERPRPFLVECEPWLPQTGLALDLAMGLGGNAGYLLDRGLDVVGMDISGVALRQARRRLPGLMAVQADLTYFRLPPAHFDLIIDFYYLERRLFADIIQALKPGGVLIFETMTEAMRSVNPQIEPGYLLGRGELIAAFSSLEILAYSEGWVETSPNHPRAVASLAARRP